MGLQIEIVERSSVIVVTLAGVTDVAAIEPLQDALRVAATEGRTVVLDITELSPSSSLTGIVDALGSAVSTLKLVRRPMRPMLPLLPIGDTELYPSVGAAIADVGNADHAESNSACDDLATKFRVLQDRYVEMIEHCRQLLQDAEKLPQNGRQPRREA